MMKYVRTLLVLVISFGPEYSSLQNVDFANFSYPWVQDREVPMQWRWLPKQQRMITLRHGKLTIPNSGNDKANNSATLRFQSRTFGDLIGDGSEEALVILRYSSGGTANWSYLYVFKLLNGQPAILGVLESGSRGSGGLIEAEIDAASLVVTFADPDRTSADCCSEGFVKVRYRWNGSAFLISEPLQKGSSLPGKN